MVGSKEGLCEFAVTFCPPKNRGEGGCQLNSTWV